MLSTLQIGTGCAIAALYALLRVIYRLWLHPLAHFPGPKLAVSTFWYQFYYDAIRQGEYMFRIREMHTKYGKVAAIPGSALSLTKQVLSYASRPMSSTSSKQASFQQSMPPAPNGGTNGVAGYAWSGML